MALILQSVAYSHNILTSEPVKQAGSSSTSSDAVVGSVESDRKCFSASDTRSSCRTPPAAATTCTHKFSNYNLQSNKISSSSWKAWQALFFFFSSFFKKKIQLIMCHCSSQTKPPSQQDWTNKQVSLFTHHLGKWEYYKGKNMTAYHSRPSVMSCNVVLQIVPCDWFDVISRPQDCAAQRTILISCCM